MAFSGKLLNLLHLLIKILKKNYLRAHLAHAGKAMEWAVRQYIYIIISLSLAFFIVCVVFSLPCITFHFPFNSEILVTTCKSEFKKGYECSPFEMNFTSKLFYSNNHNIRYYQAFLFFCFLKTFYYILENKLIWEIIYGFRITLNVL